MLLPTAGRFQIEDASKDCLAFPIILKETLQSVHHGVSMQCASKNALGFGQSYGVGGCVFLGILYCAALEF